MRQTFIRVIPWLAALILSAAASAQTFPLSIQGKLTGVPDGQQSMTLRIWDAATEGNEVASVPFVAEVNGGVFSSVIDTPTSAFSGADRWWSVQCGLTQTAPERVASVPFAISTRSIHGHTYHGVLTGQGFQATSGAFGEWGFHGGFSDGAFPNWLNS